MILVLIEPVPGHRLFFNFDCCVVLNGELYLNIFSKNVLDNACFNHL